MKLFMYLLLYYPFINHVKSKYFSFPQQVGWLGGKGVDLHPW
jgi:hypothetical protein